MKPAILIVDDDSSVRKLVARTLGSVRFKLVTAVDGVEGLERARREEPALILLDVDMPLKNGRAVLRELRGDPRTRMIPVIFLTGLGAVTDRVEGLEAGADDFISKPFAPAELKARVDSALRRDLLGVSANPLTRLPGGPLIEEEAMRRVRSGERFAFMYVDVDHFKPFNDSYGFAAGDRVIRETADVLLDAVRAEGGEDGFVGHIGGDDFAVIVALDRAPATAQAIASGFDAKARDFYRAVDRERGFNEAVDREGVFRRFYPLTLSIGIATNERRDLNCWAKIAQIASEMKAFCKARPDRRSSLFGFDRRGDY